MAPTGYPMEVVRRARALYRAGWTNCTELSRILEVEIGSAPNPTTIRKWVDPDYAELCRIRRQTGGVSGPNREKTWQRLLRRMRELREIGLSYRSIAALMSHDFPGVDLKKDQVEAILRDEVSESTLQCLLWPEAAQA